MSQSSYEGDAPAGATCPGSHYPTRMIDVWRGHGGARFTLRPVLPQDDRSLGAMFQRLSRLTAYHRFRTDVSGLTADALRSMTRVDYRRHLAIVITTTEPDDEIIVAEARYIVADQADRAEFAIVVDDRWQHNGLGARALVALGEAAGRFGLSFLHATVLRANAPMLSLVERCGFHSRPDCADARLVRVERQVGEVMPSPGPISTRPVLHWSGSRDAPVRGEWVPSRGS